MVPPGSQKAQLHLSLAGRYIMYNVTIMVNTIVMLYTYLMQSVVVSTQRATPGCIYHLLLGAQPLSFLNNIYFV